MCKRIRKGCTVSINPSFIEEYERVDLNPEDIYRVVNVVSVCGDKKVANLINTRTLSKLDLFTCNLILV